MAQQNGKELVSQKTLDQNMESDVKSFGFRETLTSFSLTANEMDLTLTTTEPIPRLKNCFHRSNDRINANLNEGYKEAVANNRLIPDYRKYRINKWKAFLEVLKSKDIVSKEEPKVVAFGDIIEDMFGFKDWKFYGIKYKGFHILMVNVL